MRKMICFLLLSSLISLNISGTCKAAAVSNATQECLDCHAVLHPGIVENWKKSRHARITPKEAVEVNGPGLKISSKTIPADLQSIVVGCAECHTLRPSAHQDTVDHMGHEVHVVVSPKDCAVCHSEEEGQYSRNIMAHAHANLAENPVYNLLEQSILGKPLQDGAHIRFEPPHPETRAESCYHCHGTRLKLSGFEVRNTDMGEMQFPIISGWPNQGAGRINLDGSLGSCTACHGRHTFSIEAARKPDSCKKCHTGPDVPAHKVYTTSKHGSLFSTLQSHWDFQAMPWKVGKDFTAPTCAACHISLIVNAEGATVAARTHQMSDRLAWRLFGLIYAHPQPIEPDTTLIHNADGLMLPTDFSGQTATDFLIDSQTREKRTLVMQNICHSCHSESWVKGHWQRLEHAIAETNAATATATGVMIDIWKHGLAAGLDRNANPFDEAIEKKWTDTWLLYANNIRFSAAMAGGGEYSTFADGRYFMNKRIMELNDWLNLQLQLLASKKAPAAGGAR